MPHGIAAFGTPEYVQQGRCCRTAEDGPAPEHPRPDQRGERLAVVEAQSNYETRLRAAGGDLSHSHLINTPGRLEEGLSAAMEKDRGGRRDCLRNWRKCWLP